MLQQRKLDILQQSYRLKLRVVAACVLLQKYCQDSDAAHEALFDITNQAGLHSGFAASYGETKAPQKVCLSEEGQVVKGGKNAKAAAELGLSTTMHMQFSICTSLPRLLLWNNHLCAHTEAL